MRRLLSILLLATFALPLVAPLLALGQDPDAGLPVCCRRHGQHHCAMLDGEKDPSSHRFTAVCPFFPQHRTAPTVTTDQIAYSTSGRIAAVSATLLPVARSEASRRIARERARHKRGPPKDSLEIV